ncbi:MAG: MerR family transcriptional regulator [Defluviitaleaceae bacterium]|nr:MerR family transcriptional regulator [Defluviitaleaceae bacterium]
MIKIGDFSKLSKVSIRMLRHYNEIGLLVPIHVDEFTSYRYYGAEQLSTASKIQSLKDMGFGLSVIKDILNTYGDTDSLRNYLKIQHSHMKQEAEEAEKRLRLLENALKRIGDDFMNYAVMVKDIPERYVASLRKIIPSYSDEGMLWGQLYKETASLNMQTSTPCFPVGIYHNEGYTESDVDVEIQTSVIGSYKDTENVRFKTVPPITVASCIVKGPYENHNGAFEAIAAWVTANNYDFDGVMFSIYHVSPGHDPNPENWVTEVCYPVKKK